MGVDEVLGPGECGGALAGGEVTGSEGVCQFFEVQDVVAVGAGWDEEVDVQVVDDEAGVGVLDLDDVDVPPTVDGTLEDDRSGQLDALVEQ
jgi:hypothetical protein